MRFERVSVSGAEPLTVQQAKAWCRVDSAADDALVEALVAAAREHVEAHAGLSLRPGVWRAAFSPREIAPGARPLELPRPPFSMLASAEAALADGTTRAVTLSSFAVSGTHPAWLSARSDFLPPDGTAEIRVEWRTDAAVAPAAAKQAMLLLVGHWYEHREAATPTAQEMREAPHSVSAILDSLKTYRL